MGVTVNKGGGGFSLYTGVINMEVIAVNPTLEELKELGYNYQKEPQYELLDDAQELEGHKIDFYLEAKTKDNKKVQAVHTIFAKDITIEGVLIDEFGRFSADPSKLVGESQWHPKHGEIDLVNFMESLCNVQKDDQNYIEDMDIIINEGNVDELRGYIKEAEGNLIKVLLGVRKGKYQCVFGKQINRSWSDKLEYLWKRFKANEKYMKDEYYGEIDMTEYNIHDFKFQEYIPEELESTEKPAATESSMGGNRPKSTKATVNETVDSVEDAVTDEEEDDLPF